MSQHATCYSCESAAVRWQTVAHGAHSSQSQCLWKFGKEKTHSWLMWQQTHVGLWPCVNPDTCGLLSLHLSLRLQRSASNWLTSEPADGTSSELLQSMSMGPGASLHPANTSAPPEVCVCMYIRVCGLALCVSSCLTPTALHLLRLRPWNRWAVRLLRPDVTFYLAIQAEYMWWIFLSISEKLILPMTQI